MKVEIGKYYKYFDRKLRDRGIFKCVSLKRKKASIKQGSLLIKDVPTSILYLRNISQIFKDYK